MIKMKIDIAPFGCERGKYTVWEIEVINDGSHAYRPVHGNYEVNCIQPLTGQELHFAVKNHLRSEGIVCLIHKVMLEMNILLGKED